MTCDWPHWWTMPVLIFAGIVAPAVDLTTVPEMPANVAVIVGTAALGSWAVLVIAATIAALWCIDRALEIGGRRW
jgi:hypothetical protein